MKVFYSVFLTLIFISSIYCQHPADNYTIHSLSNVNYNRVATKLTPTQLNNVNPSHWGFRWNSGDNSTLNWRPQGITGITKNNINYMAVSWYGRSSQNYEDRGARVSIVDLTDENNLVYRHVLLVDENYNTFPDMHAGGLAYINDTLYVPDSRSGGKYILRFDINKIKVVPSADLATFYNYGYILQAVAIDTVPIKPSFISYDWDSQELVTGSFNNCGTPYCTNNTVNTIAWQPNNDYSISSPYYNNFFGKMQGVASRNHINNNSNKMLWAATSYGSGNSSYLYATSFDPGVNNTQANPVSLGENYNSYTFPPGLEDLYITSQSDTIWTLTEFGTNEGSNNNRDVFAIAINEILPPGVCLDSANIAQDILQDDFKCQINNLNYDAYTDYVSYATFQSSESNWVNINSTANALANSNRSAFMWIRKNAISSTEVLLGINTSTGGNISNLQIGTNQSLQIYDGGSSHSGTTDIVDGQWHHVGYTYNESTSETIIYVDGNQEITFTNSQTATTTSQISLGQEFDSGNISNLYNGDMTEVNIWNTVLTPTEINTIATSAITPSNSNYSNLVAYYSMNEVCGGDLAIVDDNTANGNNGFASHPNIQSLTNLSQIQNFNSAFHFSKTWKMNGAVVSNLGTLNLSNYNQGTYSLELNRNNISINDNWQVSFLEGTDIRTGCNSYTWLDGINYSTNNNTATYIMIGGATNGCDSLLHLDLTILSSTSGTDIKSECAPYTWIDGNSYTTNNNTATYTMTGGASNGCDSIVTLNLTINSINSNVTLNNASLSSDANGLEYQWIDCDNNLLPITGETNQTFNPINNGSYAVIITDNLCSDTSECVEVLSLDITKNLNQSINAYPNPTNGLTQLDLGKNFLNTHLIILTVEGKKIKEINEVENQFIEINLTKQPKGIYYIKIENSTTNSILKIIKK